MFNIALISAGSLMGFADFIKGLAVFGNENVIDPVALANRSFMDRDATDLRRLIQLDENFQGLGLGRKSQKVIERIGNAIG